MSKAIVFQDTSVLVNFHRAGLVPVLAASLENVAWVATVQRECRKKERDLDLPGLAATAHEVLGEPLVPDDAEHRRIRILRSAMAAPGDHPDEHLGEAETLAIIEARGFNGILATDDRGARHFAGTRLCLTTWDLVRLLVRGHRLTDDQAKDVWTAFVEAGGRPSRTIASAAGYVIWLAGKESLYPPG